MALNQLQMNIPIPDASSLGVWAGSFDINKLFSNELAIFALSLIVLLVLLVVVMALTPDHRVREGFKDVVAFTPRLKADNLFLKVTLNLSADGDAHESAYLRCLGLRTASFISSANLTKGQMAGIRLGSLPDFPDSDSVVEGRVVSRRSLGGKPEKFYYKIRFATLNAGTRAPLVNYITRLVEHSGMPHGV